jgi:hypothetical protein
MQAVEPVKDVVPTAALPGFGLDSPARRIVLKTVATTPAGATTNNVVGQINFGIKDGKVYAMRSDESFVYAINPSDLNLLPSASWQMRDRRIWNFNETEVAKVTIRQGGKTRELIRNGPRKWALAPGSQGMLDDVFMEGIEETAHRLGDLSALSWLERGDQNRTAFGFTGDGWQIAIELKNGRKAGVEFGGITRAGYASAITTLDGQPWIFEFPVRTYQMACGYLTIPASLP